MGLLRLGSAEIDLVRLRVARGGHVAPLTAMEARLLAFLAGKHGGVVDQDELLREVWGYSPKVKSRTVETTMGRLRAKIEEDPTRPRHLLTVRGAGYRLDPGAPATALLADEAVRAELAEADLADDALVVAIEGSRGRLAHALKWGRALPRRDLVAGFAALPADAAVLSAVEALDPAHRRCLIALSDAVGSFDVSEAVEATRDPALLDAIGTLRATGLLRAEADRYVVPAVVRELLLDRRVAEGPEAAADAILAAAPAWLARGPWARLEALVEATIARRPGPERAALLWGLLAKVRLWAGRTDAAEAAAERALRSEVPRALLAAAEVVHGRGRSGATALRELTARARIGGDDLVQGVAERLLALADRYDGALDEAGRRLEESARLCRRAGDRGELSETLRQAAMLHRARADYAEAMRHLDAARALCPGDLRRNALLDEAVASVQAEVGKIDLAAELLHRSRAGHAALGARRRELHVLLGLGDLYVGSGSPDPAEPVLRDALALVLDVADVRVEAAAREIAARAAYDRGRYEESRRLAEASAATFAELGEDLHRALALQVAGQAAHAARDLDAALVHYEATVVPLWGTPYIVPTLASVVLALRAAGRDDAEALQRVRDAMREGDRRVLTALEAPRQAEALLSAGTRDVRALVPLWKLTGL